jgi:hypothetical protein
MTASIQHYKHLLTKIQVKCLVTCRQQLKQLSATHTDRPYQSVCVVLSGRIDRETKSDGFAADYDGLNLVFHQS